MRSPAMKVLIYGLAFLLGLFVGGIGITILWDNWNRLISTPPFGNRVSIPAGSPINPPTSVPASTTSGLVPHSSSSGTPPNTAHLAPTPNVVPQIGERDVSIGPWRFVNIPPGFTQIGSPIDEPGRLSGETLGVAAISDSFFLLSTEAPRSLVEFVETGLMSGGDHQPAANLSFDDAVEVCHALSKRFPGIRFRLPTEIEWEHAARQLGRSPLPIPPTDIQAWDTAFEKWRAGDKDFLDRFVRHYAFFGASGSQPCAQLKPNAAGLYDMAGNVWEWCDSEFPTSPDLRPVCGGAWASTNVWGCRIASRSWENRSTRKDSIGFRIVLEVH